MPKSNKSIVQSSLMARKKEIKLTKGLNQFKKIWIKCPWLGLGLGTDIFKQFNTNWRLMFITILLRSDNLQFSFDMSNRPVHQSNATCTIL